MLTLILNNKAMGNHGMDPRKRRTLIDSARGSGPERKRRRKRTQ